MWNTFKEKEIETARILQNSLKIEGKSSEDKIKCNFCGEDESYCRGHSVGHGVGYSGGEDSYCKVQSVVCSGLRCI